jgi:hypothetical protein
MEDCSILTQLFKITDAWSRHNDDASCTAYFQLFDDRFRRALHLDNSISTIAARQALGNFRILDKYEDKHLFGCHSKRSFETTLAFVLAAKALKKANLHRYDLEPPLMALQNLSNYHEIINVLFTFNTLVSDESEIQTIGCDQCIGQCCEISESPTIDQQMLEFEIMHIHEWIKYFRMAKTCGAENCNCDKCIDYTLYRILEQNSAALSLLLPYPSHSGDSEEIDIRVAFINKVHVDDNSRKHNYWSLYNHGIMAKKPDSMNPGMVIKVLDLTECPRKKCTYISSLVRDLVAIIAASARHGGKIINFARNHGAVDDRQNYHSIIKLLIDHTYESISAVIQKQQNRQARRRILERLRWINKRARGTQAGDRLARILAMY